MGELETIVTLHCGYCKYPLEDTIPLVACPTCESKYHINCVASNEDKCSAYACPSVIHYDKKLLVPSTRKVLNHFGKECLDELVQVIKGIPEGFVLSALRTNVSLFLYCPIDNVIGKSIIAMTAEPEGPRRYGRWIGLTGELMTEFALTWATLYYRAYFPRDGTPYEQLVINGMLSMLVYTCWKGITNIVLFLPVKCVADVTSHLSEKYKTIVQRLSLPVQPKAIKDNSQTDLEKKEKNAGEGI